MDPYNVEIERYAELHTGAVNDLFVDLRDETYRSTSAPQMQVGKVEGTFLRFLVHMTRAERVLEVGTFTGYSALMMASALPEGGTLHTLDRDEKVVSIAKRYFDRSGFGHKIIQVMGDARETISRIQGPIDLAFIDADKTAYDIYYEAALKVLRPGGMIALDNMLWDGEVLDPQHEDGRAIDAMNRKITADERVENVLLTVRDGIMLVRKK